MFCSQVIDPANNLAAFHCTTGVPVALDETVDDAFRAALATGTSIEKSLAEYFEPTLGVSALVLKPSVLGGLEACAAAAQAARSRGVAAVVTTAFESGVGVAACANLARALDAAAMDAAAKARADDTRRTEAERLADAANDGEDAVPFRASREARMRLMNSIDAGSFEPSSSGDGIGDGVGIYDESSQSQSGITHNPVARLTATRHGLGTGAWLDGDSVSPPAAPLAKLPGGGVGVDLASIPRDFEITAGSSVKAKVTGSGLSDTWGSSSSNWGSVAYHAVETDAGVYSFRVVDSGPDDSDNSEPVSPPVVLLHGFMGGAEDWNVVAAAIAPERRCVAVDLPSHGGSFFTPAAEKKDESSTGSSGLDLDSVAEAVAKLITQRVCPSSATGAVLVGYSMGARLALRTAASHPECAAATVSIGGSGGIRDERQRALRADRDDSMAEALADGGVGAFVNAWYRQGLFRSLSAHPRWRDGAVARRRAEMFEMSASSSSSEVGSEVNSEDVCAARDLARVISAMSPGRQTVLRGEDLARVHRGSSGGVTLLAGERDSKFVATAIAMAADANAFLENDEDGGDGVEVVTVPGAGHAVHLEAPEGLVLPILRVVRRT